MNCTSELSIRLRTSELDPPRGGGMDCGTTWVVVGLVGRRASLSVVSVALALVLLAGFGVAENVRDTVKD
jgi:hypothetical protein